MPFDSIESLTKKYVVAVQDYAILAGRAIANIFQRPHYFGDLITQADSIGIGSLPIVILTGFFTGGVLALQSASSLAQFGATRHYRGVGQPVDDQRTWPGTHQPHGLRAECVGNGQRAGFDDGDRAD